MTAIRGKPTASLLGTTSHDSGWEMMLPKTSKTRDQMGDGPTPPLAALGFVRPARDARRHLWRRGWGPDSGTWLRFES